MSQPGEAAVEDAMRRALALAEQARGQTGPNPLVGCVLLQGATRVGEGWHRRAGGPHAEVEALRSAGARARGATAVVTLEPCAHTGRTPPCTDVLLAAGVERVVAALPDPHLVASGGGEQLRAAGVGVTFGLLAEEAAWQNRVFLHGVRTATPWVVAKAAVSLDGRIAAADGTSQWLTGPATRRRAHALRAAVDAVVVGSGTVLADDPALTVRLDDHTDRQPLRVVLDRRGRTPPSAQVLDDAAPTLVITSRAGRQRLREADVDASTLVVADVADVAEANGVLDLRAAFAALWELEVRSLLVEGGGRVLGSLVAQGAAHELVVHVAGVLLGEGGRPMVLGDGIGSLGGAPRLHLMDTVRSDDDVVLTYAWDAAGHAATAERRN